MLLQRMRNPAVWCCNGILGVWCTLLTSLLAPCVCVCVAPTQTTNISQSIVADSVVMYQRAGTHWCKGVPMCTRCTNVHQRRGEDQVYQCAPEHQRTRGEDQVYQCVRSEDPGEEERAVHACQDIFPQDLPFQCGRGTLEKIHSGFIFVLTTHTSRHLIAYQPFPTLPCLNSQKEIPGIPL